MTPDYTKTCWSCGSPSLVSKGDYYQCTKCGATWNEVPRLDAEVLTGHRDYARGSQEKKRHRSGSPSNSVIRRAAKKRG